jgi:3-dehydrosphinganine reductase
MNFFQDKKVVITGGSSGIGKAAALLLSQGGAHVCICARDSARLEEACRDIRSQAISKDQVITFLVMDVADRRQVRMAAPEAVKRLGGIDMLINSAGITWPGYFKDIPDGIWDSMIQVDYMGTVNAVRAFAPYFMEQKHGTIVNVASVVGYKGLFGYAAYSPAKFAVVGFSECLRQELIPYDVRVSVIYPPDTDTPQWHEENRTKPQETRVLTGAIKVSDPSMVALSLLKGAARGTFFIIPGAMNKITYYMNRHFPTIVWMITSSMLRKYWKKHPIYSV